MTRNNWIAVAMLATVAAVGACSPKGGQAGQPDEAVQERDRSAATPVSYTVPSGTRIDMTINDELSSRKNKAGDTFTAKIVEDVRDPSGNVVIDAGSTVNGLVTAVKPAPNRRTPGTLTLALSTVEANGKTYPIIATIDEVQAERRNRPVDANDAGRVAVGAAAGAAVGQVLSKNTKGTVIGAVVGGMAGAGYAAETKDVDIVLPDGAHILVTVSEPLTVTTASQ
ncbi:MAG: glycine zipper domain-containing protein [Gemmatimonadales bacterium]